MRSGPRGVGESLPDPPGERGGRKGEARYAVQGFEGGLLFEDLPYGVRASLPYLEKSDAARIVNVASTEALGAQPFVSAYTASKHGVLGLTRALAVELGRKGITANAICPGPIHTGMTANIPDEAKLKFARRRVPLGRYGQPEEVAHAIFSLVLPASSFITGACLSVDGGMSIQN